MAVLAFVDGLTLSLDPTYMQDGICKQGFQKNLSEWSMIIHVSYIIYREIE